MSRIGILLVNRANWARSKTVVEELQKLGQQLFIYSASTMNLNKYGRTVSDLPKNDLVTVRKISSLIEGDEQNIQSLNVSIILTSLAQALENDQLDALIVVADRYEIISGAIAASYQNTPLIHIQGGEISGNIDQKVRQAVTMLADVHFPCTDLAYERVKLLRPESSMIFNYGCPAMDLLELSKSNSYSILKNTAHLGSHDDNTLNNYCLCTLHPETENFDNMTFFAEEFFKAISEISQNIHCVVQWPNNDAGGELVSKVIRRFREYDVLKNVTIYKNFHPEDYPIVLKDAKFTIGNSSSFIREGAHLNVPCILVGDRQKNRDIYNNVIKVKLEKDKILGAYQNLDKITENLNSPFGSGHSGKKIANKVLEIIGAI